MNGGSVGPSISMKREIVKEGRRKGRGLHTLKPDVARLQGSEVHYGLNSKVWMAYLESVRRIHHQVLQGLFITLFQTGQGEQRAEVCGSRERTEQASSVYVYIV